MSTRPFRDRFLARLAAIHAQSQYHRFLRATRRAVDVQSDVLRSILACHADSDYGRAHGFSAMRSYADFTARVPVQTYEDLRPFIERVMKGEPRALLGRGQRVLMFAMTSGSTDQPKYVPVTPAFLREYRRGWNTYGVKALLDHPNAFLRPILRVVSPMDESRTESGIPCGAISGLLAATQKRIVRKYYATPTITCRIADPVSRYYTIMRLTAPNDVGWMITASPATQLQLARAAAVHAQRLIRDVHDGTLDPPGSLPDDVRLALVPRLQPDHAAAQRLAGIVERHGELAPKHFWNLALLSNWTGGTMGLHLREFPRYFGDVPVRDMGLLATEGRMSVPLEDGTPAGVLDVASSFFEFVDAEADSADRSAVVRCHEVLPGREYRVLLTTYAGLYRYDIGDRVRVHGSLGQAPIIEFLHRGSRVSSITGEKLTEAQATAAMGRVCAALDQTTCRFVLAPVWAEPPYYRLYVDEEVRNGSRWSERMDRELSAGNVEYESKRKSGRLGAIAFQQLPPGTLTRLDVDKQRRHGAASEQFKPQYLLSAPGDDAQLFGLSEDVEESRPIPPRPAIA